MAGEILKRDQNFVTVLGGVTNDSDQDVRMLRLDPITKRLLISATISGGSGVTSLNGLTGAVVLAAGSNITLTPVGNTITIAATGITVPVSLTNGGWGANNNRTDISNNGSVNNLATPTAFLNWTGSSMSLIGIAAGFDGQIVTIYNGSTSGFIFIFGQNAGASPANRIINPGTDSSNTLDIGRWITLRYNSSISRWVTIEGLGNLPIYAFNNGNGASSGTVWYGNRSWGLPMGIGYGIFNATRGGILFPNGSVGNTYLYQDINNLFWDIERLRLGVQTSSSPQAPLHIANNLGETVGDVSPGSPSLPVGNTLADVVSANATQLQGNLYAVTSQTASPNYTLVPPTGEMATINYGGSGYIATGNTVDYVIYDSVSGTYSISATAPFSGGMDDISTNPYQIDLAWTAPTGGGIPDNYRIYRQVNGGGYNDYQDVGNTLSFSDMNSGWNGGSPPPSPQQTAFAYTASGQTIDYQIWQFNDDGMGTITYSTSKSVASMTADSSGATFENIVSWTQNSGGTQTVSGFRIYRNINGAGYSDYYDTTSNTFNDGDGSMSWTSGSAPPSPQYDDYPAVGTTRAYLAYDIGASPSGALIYSPNGFSYGFTDDNSNNTYVVNHGVSGGSGSTGIRIIGAPDGSSLNEHFELISSIEKPSTWIAGATVTPNAYGILSDGTALNRDYYIYAFKTVGSGRVYSATPALVSVTDPTDGQYHYVSCAFSAVTGADGYKILRSLNGGLFDASYETATTTLIDDALQNWGADVVVTPTSYFSSTAIFEQAVDNEAIQIAEDSNGLATIVSRATVNGTVHGKITLRNGGITALGTIRTSSYTVSTLPSGTQGDRAFVTDALLPTFLGTLTGGGAVKTPVFYNGSAWVAG